MGRRARNMQGQRTGKLVAVRIVGRDEWGGAVWECRCDCGGTRNVSATMIMRQKTRSCGCTSRGGSTPGEEAAPVNPRATMPRQKTRPWLMLTDAERAILQDRIDKMLIHAARKQEGVTVNG